MVELFDENRLTRDDFLGRVVVPFSRVSGNTELFGYPLLKRSERSNVSGNAFLRVKFAIASKDISFSWINVYAFFIVQVSVGCDYSDYVQYRVLSKY